MMGHPHKASFTPPKARTLLVSTLGALVGAGVLLVLVVLPAEYGIDPTGSGKALGLTQMRAAEESAPAADTSAAADAGAAMPWEAPTPESGASFARYHDSAPKRDVIKITLQEGEEVEYKADLAKGESMLFTWSIPKGTIYYDFHGEPTEGDFPEGYFLSYGEGEGGAQNGSFTAPFTGHHGWYWLNYNEDPVTIELTLEGYYRSHEEMYRGKNF